MRKYKQEFDLEHTLDMDNSRNRPFLSFFLRIKLSASIFGDAFECEAIENNNDVDSSCHRSIFVF